MKEKGDSFVIFANINILKEILNGLRNNETFFSNYRNFQSCLYIVLQDATYSELCQVIFCFNLLKNYLKNLKHLINYILLPIEQGFIS